MIEGSWQAGFNHTPKRRLVQTAEAEHMPSETLPMAPDKAEAAKFLAALDPSALEFTFQTFDDNSERKSACLTQVLHGSLDQRFETLGALSAQGAGIFVTINETDGRGRTAENVTRVRALFVDTDGAPQQPIEAALPHIVVESSPGNYHDYWLVKDCPLEDFRLAQKKLAATYGSDSSVNDLSRVMRLPGFPHQKVDSKKGLNGTPYMVRMIDSTAHFGPDQWAFRKKQIDQAHAAKIVVQSPPPTLAERTTAAIQPPTGHSGPVIDLGGPSASYTSTDPTEVEARELLDYLDPDMPYGDWLSVLMALHDAGDHMLPLAIEWSSQGSKFQHGEIEQKWRSFTRGSGVGWATIPAMARDCGARLGEIGKKHHGVDASAPQYSPIVPAAAHAERASAAAEQINNFKSGVFRACDLHGQPVPERVWHVHDLIPANTVTLVSGDGGTGKSLCFLQLAVSTALQRSWLGLAVRNGKAVYLSAEDDKAELHRRLADITRAENATLADLGDLTLRSLAGEEALLATVAKGGTLQATPLLEAIKQLLQEHSPDLLVLDTLADYFPGNENDRAQARQFIGILRGLAINHHCAVVMLAHPSVAGMASGTGTSGSTGWNNSVRSRLYLSRVLQDGYEQNPDARVLRTMKSNYSGIGGEIALTWQNGVFVADAPVTGLDRMAANAKAERVFLSLLRSFTEQGRNVNPSGGQTYAPTVFANHPKSEGMTKRALKAAMDSLLHAGKIRIVKSGPPSKPRAHLEVAE